MGSHWENSASKQLLSKRAALLLSACCWQLPSTHSGHNFTSLPDTQQLLSSQPRQALLLTLQYWSVHAPSVCEW